MYFHALFEYQLRRVYLNGKGKRTRKGKEKDRERGMHVKGNKEMHREKETARDRKRLIKNVTGMGK